VTKAPAAIALLCFSLLVPATASAASKPKPRTGKSVVVSLAKGTVFVKKRGSSKRTRLTKARQAIPTGSTIDATRGTVRLTATRNRRGTRRQTAVFYDGAFKVTQNRASAPITDLRLVGGDFSSCTGAAAREGDVNAAGRRRRARRRLWGRGKGRFRTRGRNGSATVRGTTWKTEDSCAGTETFNRSGRVQTNATGGVDLERLLEPGQSIIYHCNRNGPAVAPLYCVLVLSQPARADQPYDLFGFGLATINSPHGTYRLCAKSPGFPDDCGDFPMHPPDANGIRAAGVGCLFARPDDYTAVWSVAGTELPVPLPFTVKTPFQQTGCVSDPPRPGIDDVPSRVLPRVRAAARNGH
jgi:hypothetical protein